MIDKLKKLKIERDKLDKEIDQMESEVKNFTIKDMDMCINIQEYKPSLPEYKMYKVMLTIEDSWDKSNVMVLTEKHIKDIIDVLSTYVGEE